MANSPKARQMGVPAGEDVFDQPEQVDMNIPPTRTSHISETILEDTKTHKIVQFNDGTVRRDNK